MTLEERSKLNYILGRLEGAACGIIEETMVRNCILDSCELLSEMLLDPEQWKEDDSL